MYFFICVFVFFFICVFVFCVVYLCICTYLCIRIHISVCVNVHLCICICATTFVWSVYVSLYLCVLSWWAEDRSSLYTVRPFLQPALGFSNSLRWRQKANTISETMYWFMKILDSLSSEGLERIELGFSWFVNLNPSFYSTKTVFKKFSSVVRSRKSWTKMRSPKCDLDLVDEPPSQSSAPAGPATNVHQHLAMFWSLVIRGEICHCRHCQRQCKIFASGVNLSRNNAIYNINYCTKYILPWFYL